eukprot:TRINITY_DN392_c2_g2_i1.p1 TRINITY_DN392_c2_g2~~TRINITY_DN392_c2_g2_i1.p1  ORF type:complete len:292 (+),score=65.62 TRINITY_DN392_c2_g2_i1:44-877(+)
MYHQDKSPSSPSFSPYTQSPSYPSSPSEQEENEIPQQSPDRTVYPSSRHSGVLEDGQQEFLNRLFKFMSDRGSPIEKIPVFDHKELDLFQLYKAVISRGGLEKIIEQKLWRHITSDLKCDPDRTDAGFRLRVHYMKYLYPYERRFFLGLPEDSAESPEGSPIPTKKTKSNDGSYPKPSTNNNNNNNNNNNDLSRKVGSKITVNFQQCDISTLKRYKKQYQLKISSNPPRKRDLVRAISQHFAQQPVDETEVIRTFLQVLRGVKRTSTGVERENDTEN